MEWRKATRPTKHVIRQLAACHPGPCSSVEGLVMFVVFALAMVAALVLLARRINRNERHPVISTALWVVMFVLLAWTGLVWLVGA